MTQCTLQSHRQSYADLASKVAACVPQDELQSVSWAVKADTRRQACFVSYALCAAAEALQDADWHPDLPADKAATGVAIGAGMSSTSDIAEAGMLLAQVSCLTHPAAQQLLSSNSSMWLHRYVVHRG